MLYVWLLVADQRVARLLSCRPSSHDRLLIEERDRLEETWTESDHPSRPARADSWGHVYDPAKNRAGERLNRFAKQVIEWLDDRMLHHDIGRVELFAGTKVLGAFHQAADREFLERVTEHAVNLAQLKPGELRASSCDRVSRARSLSCAATETRSARMTQVSRPVMIAG